MLIYNYGLFWKANDVHWGKSGKGNAGHLLGVYAKNSDYVVDFREQSGIYVLQSNFSVVYVGQAGYGHQKLFDRLKMHLFDHLSGRWDTFSWFGTRSVKENCELKAEKSGYASSHDLLLNHLEAILISTTEPALNRQSGKFGENVEQYLQYRDEDFLGPMQEEMIRELWKALQTQNGRRK